MRKMTGAVLLFVAALVALYGIEAVMNLQVALEVNRSHF